MRATSDEGALHAEILARPEADEPRRKLGELLEKRGDPRGELIRVQLRIAELHRTQGSLGELAGLTPRERELSGQHAAEWTHGLPGTAADYTLRRGFPEGVRIAAAGFPESAAALYQKAPILHLDLIATARDLPAVAASPALARIVSINLWDQKIGDDGITELARSAHVGRLAWLEASYTGAGRSGLEALAASDRLQRLAWLGFTGNAVPNPCDRPAGVEDDEILGWESTPLGEELEVRHGRRAWLHYEAAYSMFYPPKPFAFVTSSA